MSKKNVHKLSSIPAVNIYVAGIASHENDYRVSWALNESLGLKLAKTENHKSYNKRLNETREFSKYTFLPTGSPISYTLLSNRCDNGFLLEQHKNIDFILLIEDQNENFDFSNFISQMKGIRFISAVFPFDIKTLKNSDRLK